MLERVQRLLGVPYLWGGTTIEGLDCSGFTQLVYRLNGVLLDRDADQQAMEGRAVTTTPRAGDLLFFGDDRVTHVALAAAEREFLHAPMSGAFVERAALGPAGGDPRSAPEGSGRALRTIRRYLPEE